MLIGSRQSLDKSTPSWENPYITNGLIAMWDGEWNDGGGVHNPSAPSWKDCVGGYTATFNGNHTVGDNSITAGEGISAPLDIGEEIVSAIRAGAMTYEVVMKPLENLPNFATVVIRSVADDYTHFRVDFNNKVNNRFATTVMNMMKHYEVGGDGYYNYTQSIYSTVSGSTFNSQIKSLHGSKTVSGTFSPGSHAIDRFCFGGWDGADQLTFSRQKKFFCMRFYNRILTIAEKNANKAIDVQRFGCVPW